MTDPIEIMARAMSAARNLSPDSLYQHNDYEDWPEDHRNEYICAITGKPMVAIFHRAWRRHEEAARASYEAMCEAGHAIVPASGSVDMVAAFWRQKNTGTQEIGETGPDTDDMAAIKAAIEAGRVKW